MSISTRVWKQYDCRKVQSQGRDHIVTVVWPLQWSYHMHHSCEMPKRSVANGAVLMVTRQTIAIFIFKRWLLLLSCAVGPITSHTETSGLKLEVALVSDWLYYFPTSRTSNRIRAASRTSNRIRAVQLWIQQHAQSGNERMLVPQ